MIGRITSVRICGVIARCGTTPQPSGGTVPRVLTGVASILHKHGYVIVRRGSVCTRGNRLRRIAPSRDRGLSAWILAIMCCHVSRWRRPSTPGIQTAAFSNPVPSVLEHTLLLQPLTELATVRL